MNGLVYALTLFVAQPPSAAPVELGRYDNAIECDIAVRTVRVQQRGARLRCVRRGESLVEQAARAAVERSPESGAVNGPDLHGSHWAAVLP